MAAEFVSLEADARQTLAYLRGFAEFQHVRLLVTGELAVWRYFLDHQVKEAGKVEFLIFLGNGFDDRVNELPSGASDLLKQRLLSMHPNSFQQRLGFLEVNGTPLLFIPGEIFPYVPQGTTTIAGTGTHGLPYTTAADLLVYMVMSCSMDWARQQPRENVDAVVHFFQYLESQGPAIFSPQQEECLASQLDWLTSNGRWDREWWRQRLGLP
ncbi:hypothetical protein N7519_001516 [Penicillium mononematosum]|uniref:uncharacterized protein n=1 Tax=Penicillium mononematosum TaxID=268346 RepID=UPI002546D4F3|nr:uncharacterized protein N7519_001516 [Penicillium mononematosum]KAJ6191495.1 hypothetical protein N7519_001516 [Penicillium mononematosum]